MVEASVADDDAASVDVPEADREDAVVATAVVCESESVVVVTVAVHLLVFFQEKAKHFCIMYATRCALGSKNRESEHT